MDATRYRGYTIRHTKYAVHLPYEFAHDDWDLGDPRTGASQTLQDAKDRIDELEQTHNPDHPRNCPCEDCNADDKREAREDAIYESERDRRIGL